MYSQTVRLVTESNDGDCRKELVRSFKMQVKELVRSLKILEMPKLAPTTHLSAPQAATPLPSSET
jgi:hypothetical protein